MSTEKHIHITTEATTGLITLDRPKALNALSLDMCGQIKTALMSWVDDAAIDGVMITATPVAPSVPVVMSVQSRR